MIMIAIFGSKLVAGEESEGTLSILVSKPVKRSHIIFGKLAGLIVSMLQYSILLIIITIAVSGCIITTDPDILKIFLKYIPGMFLYLLLVIVAFSSFSGSLKLLPTSQGVFSGYTNIFMPESLAYDKDLDASKLSLDLTGYVSPWITILMLLMVSVAAVTIAIAYMNKKDVV